MTIPKELRFTKDHEWARLRGDIAVIGVTEFAVGQLGDITLIELPEIGVEVEAGDTIGVIESVKAVSDLYSPISGTIKAINDELEEAPERVNEDPYGEGWIVEIEIASPSEIDNMMDSDEYEAHVESLED
ncbi:MAG: glycine cleavage system protein GcvH [Proteobacteria bacterium]|nr:glycine cleavage system protein GcvH [Pseudomonadota bacterium]